MIKEIYAQASEWFVEFRSGDVDAARRTEFNAWVRTSPEHLRAYLELAEIWQDSALATREATADELIALAAHEPDNVVELAGGKRRGHVRAPACTATQGGGTNVEAGQLAGSGRRGAIPSSRAIAVAATVVLAVAAGALLYGRYHAGLYTTGTGERRSITLRDGSTILLNAQSRVRERFTDRERSLELLEGQAIFKVSPDARRPFIVHSGTTSVRAVGTQFDVYRRERSTTITVIEGKVSVVRVAGGEGAHISVPDANPGTRVAGDERSRGSRTHGSGLVERGRAQVLLTAGEQVTVSLTEPSLPKVADVSAATSWSTGTFIFKATPLADVVAQFNRYSARRVVIDGADLEGLRVSGVYSSTDPAVLLSFLREQPGIHVKETADEIVISRVP